MNPLQRRARERDAELVSQHRVEGTHAQRADLDPVHPVGQQTTGRLGAPLRARRARSHEQRDVLTSQAPDRELQKRAGWGVQPLQVVDRHEQRLLGRQQTQRAEEGRGQRPGIHLGRPRVLAQQGHGESRALRDRQRPRDRVEGSVQEIAERGEQQPRLGRNRTA